VGFLGYKPPSKGWINLAVLTNRQEKDGFSWLFPRTAKKMMGFLGCFWEPPRKACIYLAVVISCQVNKVFPWPFFNEPPN